MYLQYIDVCISFIYKKGCVEPRHWFSILNIACCFFLLKCMIHFKLGGQFNVSLNNIAHILGCQSVVSYITNGGILKKKEINI